MKTLREMINIVEGMTTDKAIAELERLSNLIWRTYHWQK